MDHIYLTESMQKYWLQILDEYWDEKDIPYSDYYDFWTYWFYQYFNEISLGESIKSAYLTWKLEQHI